MPSTEPGRLYYKKWTPQTCRLYKEVCLTHFFIFFQIWIIKFLFNLVDKHNLNNV